MEVKSRCLNYCGLPSTDTRARAARLLQTYRVTKYLIPAKGGAYVLSGPRRFRSATAERGVFIALVTFRAENLHHFYEWSGAALEKEWGKAETEQYLDEYYGCLEESQQIAVVTETP